ncbi:MAG: hypothetical protein LBN95_04825 [Prevotellaceae bacterium]|nr:hypothetical protein [Prevotellaceae bacterium]
MILDFYRAIHSYGMMSFLHSNPLGLHRSVEKKQKYRPAFRRNATLKNILIHYSH